MTKLSQSSPLLINEPPLQVLPSLAVAVGLHEAIFLQQVQYWLRTSKHVFNGRTWIYNKLSEWHSQMPFLHERTIQRAIATLRDMGVLLVTNEFNSSKSDRTSWYSIDYDALNLLLEDSDDNLSSPHDNLSSAGDNVSSADDNLSSSIIRKQEITTRDHNKRGERASARGRAAPAATDPPLPDPYAITEPEAPPPEKAKSPRNSDHPLIQAYRSLYAKARFPDEETMQFIINSNPPLDNWIRAITKWKRKGYNRMNFDGMMDWALNPSLMERERPQGKGSKVVGPPATTPEQDAKSKARQEEVRQQFADWQAKQKGTP